jgi:nucleotide-binding universal stress UspA family protein
MKHIPTARRIVAGVDGSAASMAGLRWAAGEAQLRGAELHAVCAWDGAERLRAPYAAISRVRSLDEGRAAAASLLTASVHAALGRTPQVALRAELAEGRPERVLLDRAAGAELLVLGSAGRSDQLQQVAGPVHRACLRGAPCPVVVVVSFEDATGEPAAGGGPPVAAGAAARGN